MAFSTAFHEEWLQVLWTWHWRPVDLPDFYFRDYFSKKNQVLNDAGEDHKNGVWCAFVWGKHTVGIGRKTRQSFALARVKGNYWLIPLFFPPEVNCCCFNFFICFSQQHRHPLLWCKLKKLPDTVLLWRGWSQIGPMGSSWSMKSSTMRRYYLHEQGSPPPSIFSFSLFFLLPSCPSSLPPFLLFSFHI